MNARSRAADALKVLSEYQSHPVHTAVLDLLRAVEANYGEAWTGIKPDELQFKQGAGRQVMLLRQTLETGSGDIPVV